MTESLAFTVAAGWVLFIMVVAYGCSRLSRKLKGKEQEMIIRPVVNSLCPVCNYAFYDHFLAELQISNADMVSMIDGAYEVVELFGHGGSPSQKEWARSWLARARILGANPE